MPRSPFPVLALALCGALASPAAAQTPSLEAVHRFLTGSVLLAAHEHSGGGPSHPAGLEFLEGGVLIRDDDPGSGYSHPRVYTAAWALEGDAQGVLHLDLRSRGEAPLWRIESLAGDRLVASAESLDETARLTLTRSESAARPVGAAERDALVGVWKVASVSGMLMGDEEVEVVWSPDAPAALYAFGEDGAFTLSGEGPGLGGGAATGGAQQGRWVLGRQVWEIYSPLEDDRFAGPLLILAPEPGTSAPEPQMFVITELHADALVLRSDGMFSLPVTLRLSR